MRKVTWAALAAVLVVGAGSAEAQGRLPLAVEVRGGFAVPTDEWNEDDDIGSGAGFGANVQFMATPMVGVYAGWERFSFALDDTDLEGAEANATDTGFRAGVNLMIPMRAASLAPFVQGGILFNRTAVELSDDTGSLEFESDASVGFEVGGGLSFPLGPTISVTPGVRYRRHDAEFETFAEPGEDNGVTVGYFLADVGMKFRF